MATFDIRNGVLYGAKYDGNEKTIEIPEQVKHIKKLSIRHHVERLMIGPSVLKIDKNAFRDGTNLSEIVVKNPYFVLKDECLFDRNQKVLYLAQRNVHKKLVLPQSLEIISDYAFAHCSSLTSIKINKNLKYLGAFAFNECMNLKEVNLPDVHEYELKEAVFEGCSSLKKIIIPKNINALGVRSFFDCWKLETIEIRTNRIQAIPLECFAYCEKLPRIDFCDGVENIDDGAFINCRSLVEITLPKSIRKIGIEVFSDDENLTVVTSSPALIAYCERFNIPTIKA